MDGERGKMEKREEGKEKGERIKEKLMDFANDIAKKFGKDIRAVWAFSRAREFLVVVLVDNLGKSKSDVERLVEKIRLYALKLEEKIEQEEGIQLHTDISLLTEYYEKLLENRLDIFLEVKQAIPLYDTGFFIPIKILVDRGEIRGTRESMARLIEETRKNLMEADYTKVEVLSDLYSAVIDAAEAALLSRGISFFVPKELPSLLEKHFLKEKRITKQTLDIFNTIYNLYKDYEHERKKIDGKQLDKLIQQADFFVDQMQHIVREWISA
jgi:uncharacterized protein (UPF0332 family)